MPTLVLFVREEEQTRGTGGDREGSSLLVKGGLKGNKERGLLYPGIQEAPTSGGGEEERGER